LIVRTLSGSPGSDRILPRGLDNGEKVTMMEVRTVDDSTWNYAGNTAFLPGRPLFAKL
jgi:hypothetical protein